MSKFFDETMQGLLEAVAIDQQRISNYKERKEYIGSSDIAELTLRNEGKTQPLHFGEDGSYYAYIICGEYDIPSHYTEVARFKGKVDILDDEGRPMKRKIAYIIVIVVAIATAFLIGAKTVPPTQNSKDMLDMRTVTDFKATDTGLTLYTKDGDGYYWER